MRRANCELSNCSQIDVNIDTLAPNYPTNGRTVALGKGRSEKAAKLCLLIRTIRSLRVHWWDEVRGSNGYPVEEMDMKCEQRGQNTEHVHAERGGLVWIKLIAPSVICTSQIIWTIWTYHWTDSLNIFRLSFATSTDLLVLPENNEFQESQLSLSSFDS